MLIVLNKEYRKFEAITSDLVDKMKKSKNVVQKYEENAEVYELDTVDIIFEAKGSMVLVMDKNGAQIIALDCHYDFYDKLQNAKWNLYSDFFRKVRDTYKQRTEKAKKLKEAAEKTKQQVVSAQQAKEKMLNDALEKLRGL